MAVVCCFVIKASHQFFPFEKEKKKGKKKEKARECFAPCVLLRAVALATKNSL